MSARPLALAFAALVALAAASLGLSYASLGRAAVAVALIVAAAKAAIVLMVFMELAREPATSRLAVFAAASLLGVLVALVAADVATREPAPMAPPSASAELPGPSRAITEAPAKRSAGNGEGALRP